MLRGTDCVKIYNLTWVPSGLARGLLILKSEPQYQPELDIKMSLERNMNEREE